VLPNHCLLPDVELGSDPALRGPRDPCRLDVVVVSVLVTEPKGCGFEPGQGDGFLRAIKIRSTPSSRIGSKAGGHMS
jgi:hypothetical protein